MKKELTFRKCHEVDLYKVSEFRRSLFGYSLIRSHEPEYYRWKCYQNPILPGEMWLAEDSDAVVGRGRNRREVCPHCKTDVVKFRSQLVSGMK